jgi:hypothetical protein
MHLLDLPQFHCFPDRPDVKALRHKDNRLDLWEMRRSGGAIAADSRKARVGRSGKIETLEHYQNRQAWDVFGDTQVVISFIAERHKFARFVGVWEVLGKRCDKRGHYQYRTIELPGFRSLEGRLVVTWGDGTRSWAQWLHRKGNKEISELLPPNYVMDFRGFYDFTLSHDQLVQMVNNPQSNREWLRMLSSVSGVYLLLDQESGEQYVGSAYGTGGIWARWRCYARNPCGGNVRLKALLAKYPDRYKRFQFSVLRVLEPGAPKDAVLEHEQWAKRKLGCRAFGLNGN